MREVCFCGRTGELADREPIDPGDGDWALACPACHHVDRLGWLPPGARAALVAEARHRREARGAGDRPRAAEPAA